MNRTGLIIALAIAAVVGAVFAIYPQLDVAIAARNARQQDRTS